MTTVTIAPRYVVKSANVPIDGRAHAVYVGDTEMAVGGRFLLRADAEIVATAMNAAYLAGMTDGQDLLARLIGSTCHTFRDKSKDPKPAPVPEAAPSRTVTKAKGRK